MGSVFDAATPSTAQVSAAVARKALNGLSKQHQAQVESYWDAANEEALRLLVQVLENNPKKTRGGVGRQRLSHLEAALRRILSARC